MREISDDTWYEGYFGPDYLYIDIHTTTGQEVDFLRKVLRLGRGLRSARLLDVGCGYGRHLVPLLEQGVDAYGCDRSGFMLAEADRRIRTARERAEEEHRPAKRLRGNRLVCCDNRELPFSGDFDCAVNLFNSFGYFADERDNFRMLTEIGEALRPGGLFLLDMVNRDFVLPHLPRKDWFEHDGAFVLEKKWFDPIRNRSEIDVHVIDNQGKRDYHHSIRLYSYTEMVMLLEAAGFAVVTVFGGFGGEPFGLSRDRMIILSQAVHREEA